MNQCRRHSLLALPCTMALIVAISFALAERSKPAQARSLTFAERVAHQRAIEEIYWRHRLWPGDRADAKPSLDRVMSKAQIEKKVADYLRNSQLLEDYWQRPLTVQQLQAEMDRMAQHTRQPEVLRELFAALGNDPFIIAECLARPALAERLVTNWYANDERFHGALKQRAHAELQAHPRVEAKKETTATSNEIELLRSDDGDERAGAAAGVNVNSREWDKTVQKMAATFGRDAPFAQAEIGVFSSLQETESAYYATAVIERSVNQMKVAKMEWRKESFETWRSKTESQLPSIAVPNGWYAIPAILVANSCTDDTWTGNSLNLPIGRDGHTAVWTGSEMIILGGDGGLLLNDGGRYNPTTDTWTNTSTINAPTARSAHTAVWTGSEMIVWGGAGPLNTGARYSPASDSWVEVSTTNAPTARGSHTAVWTGTEMIGWGGNGSSGPLNTGARYDPSADTGAATSITNAPTARELQTVVWTGTEMIVWGGYQSVSNTYLNSGGRYNPNTDSWVSTSITNVPAARSDHAAVWTGSNMIVWGGMNQSNFNLNTGGTYDPTANTWTSTSTVNAPAGRYAHTAIWTGSEMIIWGGGTAVGFVNTGGRYSPATNSWIATSTTGAPPQAWNHTAVWTGTEMIVWGGIGNAGGLNTGGRYNPATDIWSPPQPPTERFLHTAIWTGTEMIIWGGSDGFLNLNTGGRYDAVTGRWTSTSTTNAPSGRTYHTAVWTGAKMIIWGGADGSGLVNTGGSYDPSTDSWVATATTNAPVGRNFHTATWTGAEMIVWGGQNGTGTDRKSTRLNSSHV